MKRFTESSFSSDENTGKDFVEKKRTKSNKKRFIDGRLVTTLDAEGLSDYQSDRVISEVAPALGHSLNDLYISRSTISRARKKYRKQNAEKIKDIFSVIIKR